MVRPQRRRSAPAGRGVRPERGGVCVPAGGRRSGSAGPPVWDQVDPATRDVIARDRRFPQLKVSYLYLLRNCLIHDMMMLNQPVRAASALRYFRTCNCHGVPGPSSPATTRHTTISSTGWKTEMVYLPMPCGGMSLLYGWLVAAPSPTLSTRENLAECLAVRRARQHACARTTNILQWLKYFLNPG